MAAPITKVQPAFKSETDPDFVLKLSFHVVNAVGSTHAVLSNGKAQWLVLDIAATSLAVTQYENGKPRQLVRTAARFAGDNVLLLTRRGALLRVALNGRVLLEAKTPLTVQRIEINDPAQRLKFLDEPRLQPTEEIYLTDDFMTTPDAPSHWHAISGTWHVAGADRPQDAADPFKFIGFAPGEAVAVNADTRWFWSDYQTAVSARIMDDASAFGVVFAYRSARDFYGVSWSGAKSQSAVIKLWHRTGGGARVLAQREVAARAGQWYRVAVSTFGKNVAVYVDENLVLQARDAGVTGGQCGLYAAGEAGAEFDDLRVQSVESTALAATQTGDSDAAWQARTFATDPFMAAWGNTGSEWEKQDDNRNYYWYRGHLFEALDLQMSAALLKPDAVSRLQEVTLLGATNNAKQGFRLVSSEGRLALFADGKTMASTPLPADADLQIKIRSGSLQVFKSDGTKLLDFKGGAVHPQGTIGLQFSAPISPETIAQAVQVKSPNLMEYRFDAAPVDWQVESGSWQSTNRWACVPNWNFYGGRGTPVAGGQPLATVWNKRGFGGDQWIEAFVAPSEGTSDWMHFAFPINLNITFGATGEVLGSGYTLVYRAQDAATLLYRGGKVVARSDALVVPDFRSNPWQVYERMTETWQHLQILRQGGRIRIWAEVPGPQGHNLDRMQLIDYTDPQPLPGNRIALWTWGANGMSVAKLRVCAAKVAPPATDFLKPRTSTPAPDDNDDDNNWQHCVNPINGGAFRIDLIKQLAPFEAPALVNFDYRSTPDVALALYARVNDQLFRADFLGQVSGDGDVIPMGKVRISADGKGVEHAEFPLRQVLRTFFPSGELPRVGKLFLANLSREPEQIGGLAVNRKGAVFEYRLLPVNSIATATNKSPFSLRGADGEALPDGTIRVGVTDDSIDPAEYSVALNDHVLPWGAPGLSWSSEKREIEVDPAHAGLSLHDGETVELKITRGRAPVIFSHRWTMHVASDKTPPAPPQITTALGADRVSTFETGTDGWWRLGGEQGATLWRDTSTAASGNASLRLYHRELAGPFGAMIRDRPFDARRFPILTFSYRIPLSAKASLICEIGGNMYEIAFTDDDHTFPVIGTIANVQKDDKWHEAELDLLGAVQRANAGSTVVSKMFFADGGITNTIQDVAWHVDDFRFVPALPIGEPGTLRWNANDPSGVAGYSFVMDNAPQTVPDEVLDADTSAPAAAGATYLHVRAKDNAGNWGAPTHFRFMPLTATGASTPITVEAKIPAGEVLGEPALEIKISNAAQIDVESVRWRVKSGEWAREYSLSDESDGNENLTFDAKEGELRWRDPSLTAHHDFKAYSLSLELTASDLRGKPVVDQKWVVEVQPERDKSAPPAPYISYIPADLLGRYDFENGNNGDTGIRRSAWVFPDASTSATGRKSARVVNLLLNDFFSAFLKKHPYSVSRYPRLEFDYRFEIPNETMKTRRWRRRAPTSEYSPYHLNLVAIVNGDMQIVKFIGGRDAYNVFNENTIGTVGDVKADGQWHHASVDLGAMLRKRYPHAPRFSAEYVGTWAGGPRGYENPQGASLWLDNITFFSSRSDRAAFEWRAPEDDNGISGYAFALDHNPDTMPEGKVLTTQTRREFKGLKPGTWYFHLRARDGAGNWSATTHAKFELTP